MSEPVPTPEPNPNPEPTPQPEPTPTPNNMANFLTDEGKFTNEYLQSLPDDLGKHSILEKYNNPQDLIKGAINAQSLAGKKAEDFWTSEDADIVSKRNEIMGVPSDKSGYEYDASDIPEQYRENAVAEADAFREFASENGFPKVMTEKILQWDKQRGMEALGKSDEQKATKEREATEYLQSKWKGDKFDYNVSKVEEFVEHVGFPPELIVNNAPVIEAIFEKLVPLVENDTIIEAKQKENYATVSDNLRDLDSRMYAYTGNTNEPQYLNMVKERQQLLEKMTRK